MSTKTLKKIESITINSEDMNNEASRVLSPMFSRMFRRIASYFEKEKYKRENRTGETETGYHFIPLHDREVFHRLYSTRMLIKELRKAGEWPNDYVRFIDAGCGPGNIMLLAQDVRMGNKAWLLEYVHGIELDKKGAEIARLFTASDAPAKRAPYRNDHVVYNGDILTFKYYKHYNVVYYYCPIKFLPLQVLFEERLEDEVMPGTLILANLKQSRVIGKDPRFESVGITDLKGNSHVCRPIIRKISDGPRKTSYFEKRWIKDLPRKYHKMAEQHLAKVKK